VKHTYGLHGLVRTVDILCNYTYYDQVYKLQQIALTLPVPLFKLVPRVRLLPVTNAHFYILDATCILAVTGAQAADRSRAVWTIVTGHVSTSHWRI
jgi:hypothetical protein